MPAARSAAAQSTTTRRKFPVRGTAPFLPVKREHLSHARYRPPRNVIPVTDRDAARVLPNDLVSFHGGVQDRPKEGVRLHRLRLGRTAVEIFDADILADDGQRGIAFRDGELAERCFVADDDRDAYGPARRTCRIRTAFVVA